MSTEGNHGPWRAILADQWDFGTVALYYETRSPEGHPRRVWGRDENGQEVHETVEPFSALANQLAPLLQLDEAQLRALQIALNRYFNGPDDARALRKDYDAERTRVDRLIDYLTAPPPQLIDATKGPR